MCYIYIILQLVFCLYWFSFYERRSFWEKRGVERFFFGNLATERYGLFLGFMGAAVGLPLEEIGDPVFRYICGQGAFAWHIIRFVYFLLYVDDKEGT